MSIERKAYSLLGGLDLVSSAISKAVGSLIGVSNYEAAERGYRRIAGFERFDGRPKPSEASYWLINFDAGTAAITEGQTVTGATSAATGKALMDAVVETGSYGGGDAAGFLVLTGVSGTFQNDENLRVSAVTKCVANGTATNRGSDNDTTDATYLADAMETARALIGVVPGSGRIRGVWVYDGDTYAFRDNALATACVMHKATTGGWVAQDLGRTVDFTSGGTTEIVAGNVITGATSGATATVKRVFKTSGTWAGGDAAGRLILAGQTGSFSAENLNVGASLNVATIAANSTAHSLPAGGNYRCTNNNFYGHSSLKRMYACNGVGRAFEWDGEVFVPIITGMATDTPSWIAVHKKQLFLGFLGGSLQHSGPGDPHAWTPVLGAAELGIGEEITGLLPSVAGLLTVFGRNKVAVLYGNDSSDWDLVELSEDAGAIADTAQVVTKPIYMDDQGLRNLTATQNYGDFNVGTITELIKPILESKKAAGITPIGSMRVRGKVQYRLFWSDGTGLSIYFGRKKPEATIFDLGKTVYASCSAEDSDGNEILFFGSDDGYVYQMDSGTNFDGEEVEAYLRLAFNHLGSPTQNKTFAYATFDIDARDNIEIGVTAEFEFGEPTSVPQQETTADVYGGGGFWGEANYGEFQWSSAVEGVAQCDTEGFGTNISVCVVTRHTYEQPHSIHGYTQYFKPRGFKR